MTAYYLSQVKDFSIPQLTDYTIFSGDYFQA